MMYRFGLVRMNVVYNNFSKLKLLFILIVVIRKLLS